MFNDAPSEKSKQGSKEAMPAWTQTSQSTAAATETDSAGRQAGVGRIKEKRKRKNTSPLSWKHNSRGL